MEKLESESAVDTDIVLNTMNPIWNLMKIRNSNYRYEIFLNFTMGRVDKIFDETVGIFLEVEETLENITSQSVTELHGNSEQLYESAFGLQTTLRSHLEKAESRVTIWL
jgi:hypothetical protein